MNCNVDSGRAVTGGMPATRLRQKPLLSGGRGTVGKKPSLYYPIARGIEGRNG